MKKNYVSWVQIIVAIIGIIATLYPNSTRNFMSQIFNNIRLLVIIICVIVFFYMAVLRQLQNIKIDHQTALQNIKIDYDSSFQKIDTGFKSVTNQTNQALQKLTNNINDVNRKLDLKIRYVSFLLDHRDITDAAIFFTRLQEYGFSKEDLEEIGIDENFLKEHKDKILPRSLMKAYIAFNIEKEKFENNESTESK
jgi:hypothetical protein